MPIMKIIIWIFISYDTKLDWCKGVDKHVVSRSRRVYVRKLITENFNDGRNAPASLNIMVSETTAKFPCREFYISKSEL